MNNLLENNIVELVGEIASDFEISHKCAEETFYKTNVKVERLSGNIDIIPVIISEKLFDTNNIKEYIGSPVAIVGQFRSHNKRTDKKTILDLFVFAVKISFEIGNATNINYIYMNGFICKTPIYRKTPFEREIADIFVAVNRPYRKSDHIPCIVWGRNAQYAKRLKVGNQIQLEGRIQSREYLKKLDDGTQETRIAYEVSVSRIDVVESEKNDVKECE